MVDSIVDNLTLRTQRKGELRLELGLSTPAARLDEYIAGIKKILQKDKVENSTAFLNDITASAFLVNVDYFTAPITQEEFNAIKQQVNLDVLRLLEEMELNIAGASTDVRVTNLAAAPNIPAQPDGSPVSAAAATQAAPAKPSSGGSPDHPATS
jgi:MscS family membrane protein